MFYDCLNYFIIGSHHTFFLFHDGAIKSNIRALSAESLLNLACLSSNVIFHRLHIFNFQVPGGPPASQAPPPPFKLNIVESIERIKEEFNFLQAQYHK